MIGMPQYISKIDHFPPIDIRRVPFDIIGKLSRRLTDYFEVTFGRHPTHLISGEQIEAATCEHDFNFGNGFQNVPQPIFNGWRHSEDLDQIIGDPFGNTRLQQVPYGYLHLETGSVLDQMQDLE